MTMTPEQIIAAIQHGNADALQQATANDVAQANQEVTQQLQEVAREAQQQSVDLQEQETSTQQAKPEMRAGVRRKLEELDDLERKREALHLLSQMLKKAERGDPNAARGLGAFAKAAGEYLDPRTQRRVDQQQGAQTTGQTMPLTGAQQQRAAQADPASPLAKMMQCLPSSGPVAHKREEEEYVEKQESKHENVLHACELLEDIHAPMSAVHSGVGGAVGGFLLGQLFDAVAEADGPQLRRD